jgi:hypothetical protein
MYRDRLRHLRRVVSCVRQQASFALLPAWFLFERRRGRGVGLGVSMEGVYVSFRVAQGRVCLRRHGGVPCRAGLPRVCEEAPLAPACVHACTVVVIV